MRPRRIAIGRIVSRIAGHAAQPVHADKSHGRAAKKQHQPQNDKARHVLTPETLAKKPYSKLVGAYRADLHAMLEKVLA